MLRRTLQLAREHRQPIGVSPLRLALPSTHPVCSHGRQDLQWVGVYVAHVHSWRQHGGHAEL